MKIKKYSNKTNKRNSLGIKAKSEIGKAFITMAYLTIVGAFVTPFVKHNWVMTIGDMTLVFVFIVIFFVLGVTALNSAEDM